MILYNKLIFIELHNSIRYLLYQRNSTNAGRFNVVLDMDCQRSSPSWNICPSPNLPCNGKLMILYPNKL